MLLRLKNLYLIHNLLKNSKLFWKDSYNILNIFENSHSKV